MIITVRQSNKDMVILWYCSNKEKSQICKHNVTSYLQFRMQILSRIHDVFFEHVLWQSKFRVDPIGVLQYCALLSRMVFDVGAYYEPEKLIHVGITV